jgi:glycosyltransferase involved in cell wall biosynthesis
MIRRAGGCIASLDPLVTLTKREPHLPMGLAAGRPDLFADRKGLHLVGLTWSCESSSVVTEIATDYADAARTLPNSRFVILANTQVESVLLSQAGIPNMLANELMFVDERLSTVVAPPAPNLARFDAIYVARLVPFKRHELAASLPSLVLTHGPPKPGEAERVKGLLPRARFANFEGDAGSYAYLKDAEVVNLMNRAAVGLCLSASEGSMRVSMEYRLCGTPVVSTRSIGGRDRYLFGPHVRIVDDDADAVAAAVRDLRAQRFDRLAVREFVGRLLTFDRHCFLLNVNKLVERHFHVSDRFRSFAPFVRFPVAWREPSQILGSLEASLAR